MTTTTKPRRKSVAPELDRAERYESLKAAAIDAQRAGYAVWAYGRKVVALRGSAVLILAGPEGERRWVDAVEVGELI